MQLDGAHKNTVTEISVIFHSGHYMYSRIYKCFSTPANHSNRGIVVDTPKKQFSNTSYNFIIIVIHARTSINSLVPFGLNWPGLTWLDSAWLWLSFWTIFFNQRNVRFRKSPWPNSHHTYLFLFEAFMSSQQAFRLISTRFIWSVCACAWVSKLPD